MTVKVDHRVDRALGDKVLDVYRLLGYDPALVVKVTIDAQQGSLTVTHRHPTDRAFETTDIRRFR